MLSFACFVAGFIRIPEFKPPFMLLRTTLYKFTFRDVSEGLSVLYTPTPSVRRASFWNLLMPSYTVCSFWSMVQTLPANFLYGAFHLLVESACKILQFLNQNKSLRVVANLLTLPVFLFYLGYIKLFRTGLYSCTGKTVLECVQCSFMYTHEQRGFHLAVMAGWQTLLYPVLWIHLQTVSSSIRTLLVLFTEQQDLVLWRAAWNLHTCKEYCTYAKAVIVHSLAATSIPKHDYRVILRENELHRWKV